MNQLQSTIIFILLLVQDKRNNGKREFQLFYEKHSITHRQLPEEFDF